MKSKILSHIDESVWWGVRGLSYPAPPPYVTYGELCGGRVPGIYLKLRGF